ncbi:MAG TPA: hypothetical protein VIU46_03210 [Gallionellaceae bacterium]
MNWIDTRHKNILLAALGAGILLLCAAFWLRHVGALLAACGIFLAIAAALVRRIRPYAIFGASLLVSLAIAEVAVPVFQKGAKPQAMMDPASDYGKGAYGKISDLGWQGKEGAYTSRKISSTGETIYDVVYTIGQDGFRVTPASAAGKQRINFFGCSFTFGEGLNDNETLPYFVNQRIKNISVKNFGFHGFGAHQALAILQSDRDTTGAINFFLTAPWHAPRSSCKPEYTAGSPRYRLSGGEAIRDGQCGQHTGNALLNRILAGSRLYALASNIQRDSVRDADFELYLALVKKMAEISRARNQKFVVGFIKADPEFFRESHYSNEIIYLKLKGMADEVVDLTLAQDSKDLERKYYIHPLDKHPSGLANSERAVLLSGAFGKYLH